MKTIIVTGATSGIGFAVARDLISKGYFVIGIGHSEENCALAEKKIMSDNPEGKIVFYAADLMQQREVQRIANALAEYLDGHCGGELHALISNAGCVRSWYTTTEEGYEQQFALNYLAGFLLSYRLLPFLKKANGRVILTGSESHKGIKVHWDDVMLQHGYNPLRAYKQSKLCDILFAKGLNDRCGDKGVRAYVVDPGLVKTEIGCKQTGSLVNFIWTLRKKHGVSPEIPAQTYAFLCGQEPRPGGLYYRLSCEKKCGRQVNGENAARLFLLSENLCGIHYDDLEAVV
ncbi:MAG: SDR family NAD(P)-dependent oxidoreductase [Clostridia bacterium]|nr:SDR family NAD(P)-dependent oxidoreductase [Clostridia bacterium]NCC69362.1 SDR family NAD(P)-dependent oxidoreductase [Clostridia bacterium]